MPKTMITDLCKKGRCIKYLGMRCIAFKDPKYQWRNFAKTGEECWGICRDVEELEMIYKSIEKNFKNQQHPSSGVKKSTVLLEIQRCMIQCMDKEVKDDAIYRKIRHGMKDYKRKKGRV